MRFDLVDLKLFVAAAEARSITKGAARCALSLPSASGRIKALELEFGAALLRRERTGVSLTEAGEKMLDHARAVLRRVADMQDELATYRGDARVRVRMLANTASVFEHLPHALSSYLAIHREACIDVEECASVRIGQALADGVADLGLAIETAVPDALARFAFCDDVLVAVVAADDELARRQSVNFADLAARDFVGLSFGSALQEHLDFQAAQLGRRLRLRTRAGSFAAAAQMVAAGVGVAIIPQAAARRTVSGKRVRMLRIRESWSNRRLVVCARDFDVLSRPARRFAEHLRELVAA